MGVPKIMENYNVRSYQKDDEKEIIELLKTVFPDWANRKNVEDYWSWKYLSPPLGSQITLVTHEGKIVSVSHQILLEMKIGDTIYQSQYGDDAATHPKYQGKGVYNLMREMKDEFQKKKDVKLGYSIPIHPAFTQIKDPYTHYLPQPIVHYSRIYNIQAYLKNKKIENASLAKFGLTGFNNNRKNAHFTKTKNNKNEIDIIEIVQFDKKSTRYGIQLVTKST
jgi:hypothetical protein